MNQTKHWDSIARAYVERADEQTTAVEAFAPLVDGFDEWLKPTNYKHFGVDHAKPGSDRTAYWALPANDNRPTQLGDLVGKPGYIYLGSPYTKYAEGLNAAAADVAAAAGKLMARGFCIYSPIAHGHFVTDHCAALPLDWSFWKKQCQPMIDAASSMIVLTLPGWEESVGLNYEIACFLTAGKPVVYLDPARLTENMRAAA